VRPVFDEVAQQFFVDLEGTEGLGAVVDACAEAGAVHQDGRLYVRFPGRGPEYVSRIELRRRVLERRRA